MSYADRPTRVWATPIVHPDNFDVVADRILIHRRRTEFVRVVCVGDLLVWKIAVGASGVRTKSRARAVAVRREKIVADYMPYRPCRWEVWCTGRAVAAVHHDNLGFDIDSCRAHAAEHRRWVASNAGVPGRNWTEEPSPSCECPDTHREIGWRVAYCSTHGSPNRRGTELLAAEVGLIPDLDADNEGFVVRELAAS